tara:strand:+ start:730 stop:1278 length:549 start_codon:yes stop_codon:yes gene_type:complete
MNKQSLKTLLYALLALLIIISLFNCSQKKDTVENFLFRRNSKPFLSWYKAPKMPRFNFRYTPPTMPPTRCPSGEFLFSDDKTCVKDEYMDGNTYGQGGSFGYDKIDHDRSLNCTQNPTNPAAKLLWNGTHANSTTCNITCSQVKPKDEYKDWNNIPQLIKDKCEHEWLRHHTLRHGWKNLPN